MSQIQIENLTFTYKQDPILSDINIDISSGEFLGVIGPNGGGKTTLLKLLMGFLTPQKGKILLDNDSPQNLRPAIGYVPQHFEFDTAFPISVKEVVEMGGPNSKPLLAKLKLLEYQNRPFGTLSGGQMQRALLARALASNPKLLLLDEATSCVDNETSEIILNILDGLKNNVTILMVTHELPTIIKRVDRILCVHRTCSLLKPDEVCEHFAMGLYHPPLIKSEKR